ncbi:MAG TPA: MFS transporter [Sphingopyxis sp.]|nr:MFS transporter [Sphingopyxis sp.]HMP43703.1 MFS transporter [Sphingopyxis sp.]HMQ17665.1 MFS transporter [Sphingopyxis sp.]
MNAYPRPHEDYSTSYKYYVVFVLALVSTFNTVDRALIMVLAEPIKQEFALSDTQLGLLAGLIFAVSYSLAGIPLGMMIDRYRRTRMLAGMLAVWSCLTAASGLAGSWITLALARMGVGAAESGANPASMSLITDYFPKERRGFALSVFFASTPLGMMLSFAIGGVLAAAYGWRAVFLIFGIPGILLAILLLSTVREPRRGNYDDAAATESRGGYRLREALGTLLRVRPLLLLLLAAVCVVIAQAGLAAFLSPFLIRIHQLSIDEAGFAIALAKGPTGIAGIIAGGILADWLARRSTWAGPRMVGFLVTLAAPFAIAALFASSWQVAIVLFAAYNFFNYIYYGATFATYMTLAPVHMRGVLAGILAVALTMIGYSTGPTLAGTASDLFAAAGVADPLRWALVVTASFFAVAGGLFLAAARSIRRREAERPGEDPAAIVAEGRAG